MTTATELLYSNTTAPRNFSPWIIQQAARTAQLWHEQFKQSTYSKQNQIPWAALGIALLGVFFLLQPGKSYQHDVTKVESIPIIADSKSALVASLINEIRSEENGMQNESLSSLDKNPEDFSSADKPEPSSLNADAHLQPSKKQQQVNGLPSTINKDNPQTTMADSSQGSETGDNQLQPQNQRADAGIGAEADTNPSSSSHKDIKNMAIKLVDIELQNGTLASSDGKGMPFKEHQFTGSDKRIKLPPTIASRNTSTAYTTRFSPSQQQYVNAYFKNIHAEK